MAIAQVKRVLGWFMSVQYTHTRIGILCPVFRWAYGIKDGIGGGTLYTSPIHGTLVFQVAREDEEDALAFLSVDAALRAIATYGWGEPPHIRDVFTDVTGAHEKFLDIRENREGITEIFTALTEKWKTLVRNEQALAI
ncbi:MAG: hypothetical protein Q7S62_01815 [bacterium]|nr:hypothetical protein [bacterium]